MKKTIAIILLIMLFLSVPVFALAESDAKKDWQEAKKISQEKKEAHRNAKIEFAADKSEENKQAVIDTGKEVLHAALDEAQAWLNWKKIEADENSDVPDSIKESITRDVEKNLDTIDSLRTEVDRVTNRIELGIVFLKMVGKYIELLTDVSRNTGKMWVHIGNTRLEKAEEFEAKLREEAEELDNSEEIIEKLDEAKEDLDESQNNIDKAESSYKEVVLPGKPLIKFSEGNNYLRVAKTNLLSAVTNLNQAYHLMLRRK